MGTGAQFASPADPRTQALLSPPGHINAAQWSHPIYQATTADPVQTLHDTGSGVTRSIPIPINATAAAPTPGDQHLHIVGTTKSFVDESWLASRTATGWKTPYTVRTDLRGPGVGQGGVRAYGGSAIGGLIRLHELQAGAIRHALAFAMPRSAMKRGPVWPAIFEDGDAASTYTGTLAMGTLVAIPAGVDLEALGLSPAGLVVARALQRYGAYLTDASSNFTLYAEPSAEDLLGPARADLAAIRAQLRVVTNNSASNVGGGGERLAPAAPPFG